MATFGSRRIAWACACLASGPIYLIAGTFASAVEAVPKPILVHWHEAFQFTLLLIPAVPTGFFASAIPLGFLVLLLSSLACRFPVLRPPLAWTLSGGAAAALILCMAGTQDFSTHVAFVCTAMISLRLARAYLHWPEDRLPEAVLGSTAGTF